MKKEVVFRCQFGGNRYRVEKLEISWMNYDIVYTTYKNRKRLDTYPWGTLEGAVGSIMKDHPCFDTRTFVEVWQ